MLKIKISNIKFASLDDLINSDIIKMENNNQVVFGNKKKLYEQHTNSRIYISVDSIIIYPIDAIINTICFMEYDGEESDYLPYMDGYIIKSINSNDKPYIEYGSCLLSALKNFTDINNPNHLICDLIIEI